MQSPNTPSAPAVGAWRPADASVDLAAFADRWLQQQCALLGHVSHGIVVLGMPAFERFAPVATWPAGTQPSLGLVAAAELALAEGRSVISRQAGAPLRLLAPVIVDGEPRGVIGLELGAAADAPRNAMRQLEWGIAGLRERLAAQRLASAEAQARRADTALDSLAAALDQDRLASAAQAAVSELAVRLGCERVAIGFVRGERCRVTAISQSAGFGRKVELTRALAAAMDEAIEQRTSLIHPPPTADEPLVTRAQEQLARRGAGAVLTIPFLARGGFAGALVAERPAGQPFDQAAVDQLGAAAALLGPALDDKRRNDRWLPAKAADSLKLQLFRLLGPRHFGRKLAVLGITALLTAGWLATAPYQAVAEARVEGRVQRALAAPFDGFVSDAPVRAGDIVAEGQELARLDDRDLTLERLNRVTERQQRQLAYDRALGGRDRAEAGIARAQIEESDAQIKLLDGLIARARLTAPFAGVVVAGDLSRSIGSTVRRGEVLFQVAPLDAYRVLLSVDESQIADIHVGQRGSLLTTSLPTEPFAIEVEQITPVAAARDGRTVFQVEAGLESPSSALRPGMEGIAKVDIGERRLAWIWSRTLIDWLRLKLWAWLP